MGIIILIISIINLVLLTAVSCSVSNIMKTVCHIKCMIKNSKPQEIIPEPQGPKNPKART